MLNRGARLFLFASSYAPLAFIFFVLYVGEQAWAASVALAWLVGSIASLKWVLHCAEADVESKPDIVLDCRQHGDEVMGYVAGYLIPFLGMKLDSLREVIALLTFVSVLGYLYLATDLIYINPTLFLIGYQVNEVSLKEHGTMRIIAKRDHVVRPGEVMRFVPIGAYVAVERWLAIFRGHGKNYYDVRTEPGLLFDSAIDCICYGPHMFILKKDTFLRIFQYYEQIQEDARAVVDDLQTMLPIANKDALLEACKRDHRLATRVADLADQPHISKLSMRRINTAIKRYGLHVRTTRVNGPEQLKFEARYRWEFVWLLSDAYLTSPMTAVNYRAHLKRALKTTPKRAATRPKLELVPPQPADALL